MNKTRGLHVVFVLGLLVSLLVVAVMAQHTEGGGSFPLASRIKIESPSNGVYSSNTLVLNVSCKFLLGPKYASMSYSLDGKENFTLPISATIEPVEATRTYENGTTVTLNTTFMVPYTLRGEAVLADLSEGAHQITVYARYVANNDVGLDENSVCFTIDSNGEQEIPEFPSWTPLLVTGVTLVVVCGFFRKKIRQIELVN